MYLHHLTVSLRSHKACTIMGLQLGASISSTDENTDPNILNRHGPQPNISNRRWSRANNLFPPSHLSVPATWSVSTDVIPGQIYATDVRATSVSVSLQSPLSSDAKVSPDFYQQTLCPPKFSQPPPQLPKILSTDARYFEPGAVTPLGPSEIFATGGPHIISFEALFSSIMERIFVVFLWSCGLCTPFNVKIAVTR